MVFPIIPIIFTDPSSGAFLLEGYSQSMQFLIAGVGLGFVGIKLPFIAGSVLVVLAWSALFLKRDGLKG